MIDSKRHNDWLDKAARYINSAQVLKENDCGNDIVATAGGPNASNSISY